MKPWNCTQIIKWICQLVADLQRGRICNSLLIRTCMSLLSGGQLSTEKLVLQFFYMFTVSFPVWAGIKLSVFLDVLPPLVDLSYFFIQPLTVLLEILCMVCLVHFILMFLFCPNNSGLDVSLVFLFSVLNMFRYSFWHF